MNATWIITAFVVIDDLMTALGHRTHPLAQASDAEVLTVAIVAAKYFQNHHECALCVMQECGYLSGALSTSRFDRRLHALGDWLVLAAETLGELFATGETYVIDSMPVPVCRRVRAWRCRKVRGRIYCGYCAAKDEKFFGWRLHLVCTPASEPVRFTLLPASLHDLRPVHELADALPAGAKLLGGQSLHQCIRCNCYSDSVRRPVPVLSHKSGRTCSRLTGGTILISVTIATPLRRSTANSKRWL